jgi:hypothetical protein
MWWSHGACPPSGSAGAVRGGKFVAKPPRHLRAPGEPAEGGAVGLPFEEPGLPSHLSGDACRNVSPVVSGVNDAGLP